MRRTTSAPQRDPMYPFACSPDVTPRTVERCSQTTPRHPPRSPIHASIRPLAPEPSPRPMPGAAPAPRDHAGAADAAPRPISVVLVAILAGSGLFLSGYTLGPSGRVRPGDAGLRGRRPSSRSGTPTTPSATATPAARSTATTLDPGRHPRDDRVARRSVLGVLTSDQYRQSLQGISGQFEGIGAEIGRRRRPTARRAARRSGRPAASSSPSRSTGSPAEAAGSARRHRRVGRRRLARWPDGRRGTRQDPRAEGHRGRCSTSSAAAPTPISTSPITRDVVQTKEVEQQGAAPTARSATSGSPGFSDAAADQVVEALATTWPPGRTKLILDLRGNPGGFVTAARKVASQFIGVGRRSSGSRTRTGNQTPTDALADGVATDPDIQLVVPDRRRERVGQRDRGRRAPGRRAGDARRPAVVRQGDRPAMAGARPGRAARSS